MANLDLEHYKARLKAITPAPWHVTIRGFVPLVFAKGEQRMPIAVVKEVYMSKDERIANARFIAEAPTMVQALVEEVERRGRLLDEAFHTLVDCEVWLTKYCETLEPMSEERQQLAYFALGVVKDLYERIEAQNALKSSEVQG